MRLVTFKRAGRLEQRLGVLREDGAVVDLAATDPLLEGGMLALVAAEPAKFLLPEPSDMRYQWVQVRLAAIDETEMTEIVLDAWRMVVPKRVAATLEP